MFVGVDISSASLQEARRRYAKNIKNFKFLAYFFNQSGSLNPQQFYANMDNSLYFDIVSMQFCMHYMFDSEESESNFFKNLLYLVYWNAKAKG
jgi:mRNA (guanine-N7-)-methyltransferase